MTAEPHVPLANCNKGCPPNNGDVGVPRQRRPDRLELNVFDHNGEDVASRKMSKLRRSVITRHYSFTMGQESGGADGQGNNEEDEAEMCFYEYSTFHGLRDLFHSRTKPMQLLWLVLLVFAVTAAVYGCYAIIAEYIRKPVIVSYFVQEAPAPKKLALPDMVICPFNRFNREFLDKWNVSRGLAQYLELAYPSPTVNSFQNQLYEEILSNLDRYEYELEQLLARLDSNMTFTDFIHKATLNCESFFDESNVYNRVCQKHTEVMTSAGKCFRIAGPDQESDGFGWGQRMVIRLPHHLFNPGVNQMLNDGIAVKLVERGRGVDHDLTFVPSGSHAIFPLTATRYEFMNDPPRFECDEKADNSYSRVWCFDVCITRGAEDKCNCSVAASAAPRKPNLCTTAQYFHCFSPSMFAPENDNIVEDCKQKCKMPCSYWHYGKTISYAKFPSPEARFFIDNDTEWEQLTHTIILDIYYISLDYTVIKHMLAMTPNSFIAQIGGQVSLWIGGSIISLVQLVVYLCRYVGIQCHRRIRSNRRTDNTAAADSTTDNNTLYHSKPTTTLHSAASLPLIDNDTTTREDRIKLAVQKYRTNQKKPKDSYVVSNLSTTDVNSIQSSSGATVL